MPSTQHQTTIAQIGIGYWGSNLLRNLIANKNCNVKTVVNLSPERREFVRSQPGQAGTKTIQDFRAKKTRKYLVRY